MPKQINITKLSNPSQTSYETDITCSPQKFVSQLNPIIKQIQSHHFVIKHFNYHVTNKNCYHLTFNICYQLPLTPIQLLYRYSILTMIYGVIVFDDSINNNITLLLNCSLMSVAQRINKYIPNFENDAVNNLGIKVKDQKKQLIFYPIELAENHNSKQLTHQHPEIIQEYNKTIQQLHNISKTSLDNFYKCYLYLSVADFLYMEPELKHPDILIKINHDYHDLIHIINKQAC